MIARRREDRFSTPGMVAEALQPFTGRNRAPEKPVLSPRCPAEGRTEMICRSQNSCRMSPFYLLVQKSEAAIPTGAANPARPLRRRELRKRPRPRGHLDSKHGDEAPPSRKGRGRSAEDEDIPDGLPGQAQIPPGRGVPRAQGRSFALSWESCNSCSGTASVLRRRNGNPDRVVQRSHRLPRADLVRRTLHRLRRRGCVRQHRVVHALGLGLCSHVGGGLPCGDYLSFLQLYLWLSTSRRSYDFWIAFVFVCGYGWDCVFVFLILLAAGIPCEDFS